MKKGTYNLSLSFVGVLADITWYLYAGWCVICLLIMLFSIVILPKFTPPPSVPLHILNKAKFFLSIINYSVGIFILYNLRLFFKNISRQVYFSNDNFKRVKMVGFGFLIISLFETVIFFSLSHNWGSLEYGNFSIQFIFRLKFAILGVLVLALSRVISSGMALREENSLTI